MPDPTNVRCAECDCANGGSDCTWIATPTQAEGNRIVNPSGSVQIAPAPTPALSSAEVERLARSLEQHEWTVSAPREMDTAAATLRALVARAERAEADRDAALLRGIALGIEAAKAACFRLRLSNRLHNNEEKVGAMEAWLEIDRLDPATIAKEASE